MTSPRLAMDSPYGRVYRHPNTDPATTRNVLNAVRDRLLDPSVTNVISVMDKPHLRTWTGKLAADCAITVVQQHPGLIEAKPDKARDYIKRAAERHTTAAADLGTLVHGVVELLGRGEDPGDIPAEVLPFVNSFHDFCDTYQPEFTYHEATCFGSVTSEDGSKRLGYAGTADFIANIAGLRTIGDYKSGKSIHTEVSLQLNALAHADDLITDDDEIVPMPGIDAGMAVHLTRRGYKVHPVLIGDQAWLEFQRLRRIWDFHVRNLDSRKPLLVGDPVSSPADFAAFFERASDSLG